MNQKTYTYQDKFNTEKTTNEPESKIPPNSIEAEIAVLGSLMLDRQAIAKAVEILDENCFYNDRHTKIFTAITSMFDRGVAVDIVTLSEELRSNDDLQYIGGAAYLTEINMKTPTAANIEYYARIVQEQFMKRHLISKLEEVVAETYDNTSDAFDCIDKAESEIFKIGEKRISKSYASMKKLAREAYDFISQLAERDDSKLSGVPSGIIELDALMGGFQNSDLVILAARPSMGKTALALSVARNIAVEYKVPIAFFSIEMASIQLVVRLLSAESKINQQKIRTGKITQDDNQKIIQALGKLAEAPLIIDDTPMLTIMELKAKCRRLRAEHNIQMIVVDYLQLLHAKAESREREISIISSSLKQIAKELNIPVLALAQLNRSVESRTDKRPMLSDLRESGSIEQDADVVLFVNRPEVYNQLKYEDDTPTENTAEIIIGKQRNGPIGTVRTAFIKDFARFENLAYQYEEPPMHHQQNDDPGF